MVIETTSRRTRRKDIEEKPSLYAQLGVKEYFLFDPHGEYLDPPLQGHRLVKGEYQRIEPDANGVLDSRQLKLRLQADGRRLQFVRCDNGERLLTRQERLEHEAERADREAAARQAAEAELARLRDELTRLRNLSS